MSLDNIKDLSPDVLMLYRYFAYAAYMRGRFQRETDPEWLKMLVVDESGLLMFFLSPPGIFFTYSYAGIYLVIEGWRHLGLKDQRIDELLQSPFVDRLRLFRNATFHYQKDLFFSWKHLQFFGTEEERTEKWVNQVYDEFERFFAENTLPVPDVLRGELKGQTHVEIAKAVQRFWADRAERRSDD
jgi:hypothetical protein